MEKIVATVGNELDRRGDNFLPETATGIGVESGAFVTFCYLWNVVRESIVDEKVEPGRVEIAIDAFQIIPSSET